MINIKRKRIKNIIFLLLIIVLISSMILMFIKKENVEKNIINGVLINSVNCIYDTNSNTYYLPINLKENNDNIELNIEIRSSKFIKSNIDGNEFKKRIKLNEKLDYNKTITVSYRSLFNKGEFYIKFTNMPVIQMNFDESEISDEYTYFKFSLTDPDYIENNSKNQFTRYSKIRYRGSSTRNYEKKSYRIKMEEKIDFDILGMSNSNTWILDGIATDPSYIRTKTSSDLWNNINEDLDKEKYTELNSKYVEVYINDEYRGLYLLKETIDENLLNLDKDTGVILKGINWETPDFNDLDNINSNIYGPFELKYPKTKKRLSISFKNILTKLKEYYTGNINYNVINDTFYIENLANHRIFLLVLQAYDNYEYKNIYYSIVDDKEDTKVLITPWDLDLTFNLLWSEDKENFTEQYNKVEDIVEPYGINQDEEFKKYIKERWNVLSESALSKETVNNIIDEQYKYLMKAGALQRENEKYYNTNIEQEKKAIKDWYNNRYEIIGSYIQSL